MIPAGYTRNPLYSRRKWVFRAVIFTRNADGSESVMDVMECYSAYILRAIVRKTYGRDGSASRFQWDRHRREPTQ